MSSKTIAEASFRALDLNTTQDLPAKQTLLYGAVLYPDASLVHRLWHDHSIEIERIDWAHSKKIPGVVKCIRRHNFAAVIATQKSTAQQARDLAKVYWQQPISSKQEQGSTQNPHEAYSWDPTVNNVNAWAVAQHQQGQLHVWLSTAYPRQLRDELSVLTGLETNNIHIYLSTTALTEAYDTAVEASLMALEVHQPVYVQAEYSLKVIRLQSASASDQGATWQTNTSPNLGSSLAARLLGWQSDKPSGIEIDNEYAGDIEHENIEFLTATGQQKDYAAALVFALESEYDEALKNKGQDPLQARLAHIKDERGKKLIEQVATQAGWVNEKGEVYTPKDDQRGYGFAYVKARDYEQEPAQEVWSAWAVELSYHNEKQQLTLDKVTVAFDTDQQPKTEHNPQEKVKHRISQWAGRLLGQTSLAAPAKESSPSEQAAQQTQPENHLVDINVFNQSAVVNKPLAWSETAELPAAAAIANAVKDATNVRLYHAPLDLSLATQRAQISQSRSAKKKKWAWAGGLLSAAAGLLLVASPWRGAIPPINSVDTSIFSDQAINRGRLVAMAGDCMVCHTEEGGKTNAGGLPLDTPFGTIYSTNITPDKETGIGSWSYKAFERAMRDGIHRDGTHLYPAFPYTSYAQLSDEDLQSLYAYLMVQEPVSAPNKENELGFPFNFRPALAGWNLLFHKNRNAYEYNEDQTQLWNRGAYLVNSSGHCAACHSPRNMFGAEKTGALFLAGGEVDGWDAPALNALSSSSIPWTEDELYQYLRTGQSTRHGVAAGPMAPIISGLAELPEYDVRAMAHYLMNLAGDPSHTQAEQQPAVQTTEPTSTQTTDPSTDLLLMPGKTIYEGACAACHDTGSGPALFGARPSLAENTSIHSDTPDNLIQVILHGITRPSAPGLGNMPAFKHSLNDDQVVDLVQYLRKKHAPNAHDWLNLKDKVQAIRQQPGHL